MSSIGVMGMTSAIFLAAVLAFIWLVGKMNDVGATVSTGVLLGMPIPIKSRWLWLTQAWTMYALATTVPPAALALALAFFRIAQQTSEPDAKQLVLVFAFIGITGSVGHLLTGISAFVAYVSILRQVKAR